MKRIYYYLGGGAILLWLLTRKAKAVIPCPSPDVMQWLDLAEKMSRKNQNVFQKPVTAEILAIIHDQSQGNPTQIYYQGGWKPRYGLCGVPLHDWARAFNAKLTPEKLMEPENNIDLMLKTITYTDVQILNAYKKSGVYGPYPLPGLSANAYSAYVNSPTMVISDANDPNIHNDETINRYLGLLSCYRQVI